MKVATVSLLLVAGARCCPDGWFQVAGSCYRSSPDRLTWYQAQEVGGTNTVAGLGNTWWQDYWAQGGYLAELTSREEELAVNEVISHEDHFWLGLNDVAQEGGAHGSGDSFILNTLDIVPASGRFMWAESHQVVEYSNWNSGEPNNFFGVEDCVFKVTTEPLTPHNLCSESR